MNTVPYYIGCFCVSVFVIVSNAQDSTQKKDTLLDLLKDYDKRFRPQHGGPPVAVTVHMFISSFGPISEIDMDFSLEIYLQQQWTDERLKCEDREEMLTLDYETVKNVWVPDTFFLNEKNGYQHIVTQPNVLMRINSRGEVTFDLRITIKASCNMDFRMYPFDKQACFLKFESYSYSVEEVVYYWHQTTPVAFNEPIALSKYNLLGYNTSQKTTSYIVSNYSELEVNFYLGRDLSHQLIKTYVPCVLIVVLSWISLWIPRDATPARVTLGITTVLTLTTTMGNSDRHLPVLSYLTALDIFTTVCNFFVFAVLIEFAFVSFYDKPIYRERRKASTPPTTDEKGQQKPRSWQQMNGDDFTGDRPRQVPFTVSYHEKNTNPHKQEADYQVRQQSWPIGREFITSKLVKVNHHIRRGLQPAKVELYARIVMPLLFLIFSIIYYSVYVKVNSEFSTGHSV